MSAALCGANSRVLGNREVTFCHGCLNDVNAL
jgi:hypothetical protein